MITFRVPCPLPLSSNQRIHHAPKAQRVKALRDQAEATARLAPRVIPTPTRCIVRIGWPTKHRRDSGNAYPTIKALLDGIVRAGWLADDDDAHLIGPDPRPYLAGEPGVVVITFEFEDA